MLIELFYFPQCPFCQKVLQELENSPLKVTLLNVRENTAHRDRLIQEGGKRQVPCLFIDGKPLYESDAIIAWVKEHS